MSEDELIDLQWERANNYARRFALTYFESPDSNKLRLLRNNIFEYYRKRYLSLDYFEQSPDKNIIYCFHCLAYMPKFHFC